MTARRAVDVSGKAAAVQEQHHLPAGPQGLAHGPLQAGTNGSEMAPTCPLVAQIDEDGRAAIVGGGRYIMVAPDQAEIAFVVVDAYQSQGIGTILMRHLTILARKAAVKELVADVLPENTAMLKVFGKFGFRPASKRTFQVVHLALQLA